MDDIPPTVDQRNVRPRFDSPPQGVPGDRRVDHVIPTIDLRDHCRCGQHRGCSPPSSPPLQLPRNASPNSDSLNVQRPPQKAIAPPTTDQGPLPTLVEVNPESGSIAGGARIWLRGMDFPGFPLFARFGGTVVPTVSLLEIPFGPYLIRLLRLSPRAAFYSVIRPPLPCQVSSMSRSRGIPSEMRRSMGPVSQSFST